MVDFSTVVDFSVVVSSSLVVVNSCVVVVDISAVLDDSCNISTVEFKIVVVKGKASEKSIRVTIMSMCFIRS